MAEIGEGVRGDRLPPCRDEARRAEQRVAGLLQAAHHERAGLDVPIRIPAHRVVAPAGQQRGLLLAPGDRKLILSGEMSDAAEVEYHDRMQRVLPFGVE